MYARVTTLESSPERMDTAIRHVRENIVPQLQEMDGFRGFIGLGDRKSGKIMGVVLWESGEALRATEQSAAGLRRAAAEVSGGAIRGVEHYEVAIFEGLD